MLGRKVIYVRCINCSYNNVAKGICFLDKKQFLFIQEKFRQIRAFESYIHVYPLNASASKHYKLSSDMRFPTIRYVRPAKPQNSLRIPSVRSEP